MCSQTFTLFRLRKTAVPVKIFRYSFRVFVCALSFCDLFNSQFDSRYCLIFSGICHEHCHISVFSVTCNEVLPVISYVLQYNISFGHWKTLSLCWSYRWSQGEFLSLCDLEMYGKQSETVVVKEWQRAHFQFSVGSVFWLRFFRFVEYFLNCRYLGFR